MLLLSHPHPHTHTHEPCLSLLISFRAFGLAQTLAAHKGCLLESIFINSCWRHSTKNMAVNKGRDSSFYLSDAEWKCYTARCRRALKHSPGCGSKLCDSVHEAGWRQGACYRARADLTSAVYPSWREANSLTLNDTLLMETVSLSVVETKITKNNFPQALKNVYIA